MKKPTFDYKKCINRFELWAYIIYMYLQNMNEVKIYMDYYTTKNKNNNKKYLFKKEYPKVDFTILVDNKGFHRKNKLYIHKLKDFTKYTICSINYTNIHIGNENIIFYIRPGLCKINNNKSLCINWLADDKLCKPQQTFNSINILIGHVDNYRNGFDIYDETLKKIINFSIKYKNIVDIIIKVKKYNQFNYYDLENNTIEQEIKQYIIDRYDEYGKTNVFFVTNPNEDELLLVELAMCNVLIVAPINCINKKLEQLIEPILYSNNIPWSNILNKLKDLNIRSKLLQNNTWENAVVKIYNKLLNSKNNIIKNEIKLFDKTFKNWNNVINRFDKLNITARLNSKKIALDNYPTKLLFNDIKRKIKTKKNNYYNERQNLPKATNNSPKKLRQLLQSNILNFRLNNY